MKGLVHIYTGNGKGKTTAAIGLGMRAAGNGFKVLMVQFAKASPTGETAAVKRLEPDFVIKRGTSNNKFLWNMTAEEKKLLAKEQEELLDFAGNEAASGRWQVVILDEIIGAMGCGVVCEEKTFDIILNKPENVELVLTGRNASEKLVKLADYVSEINEIKHPARAGVPARKGIEY